MSSYCDYAPTDPLHAGYHDHEYGFPIYDDNELFERLVLEINQAGLSWGTILKKRTGFKAAYANFDIAQVAYFTEADRARLLADAGIIRNRLKVNAAIENAKTILQLQLEYGSFKAWLDQHHPKALEEWVKLFKQHFKFVGGEIVNEFLVSSGYLPNAHKPSCPVYAETIKHNPPWMKA